MILQNSLSSVLNIRVCSSEEEIEANEFLTSIKLELLVNKEKALIIPMFSARLLLASIMNISIYITNIFEDYLAFREFGLNYLCYAQYFL